MQNSIVSNCFDWIPAFAGMTNLKISVITVMPVKDGMTGKILIQNFLNVYITCCPVGGYITMLEKIV